MISLGTQAGTVESPFTPEQQQRFDAGLDRAIARYPSERRKAALLAALHLAQDELGWLSEPAMAYVGSRLDVPPVRVREVATFYTMYRLHPVGRHHIGVCNRSEEHTSELQSLAYLVCRLLLEKKKERDKGARERVNHC